MVRRFLILAVVSCFAPRLVAQFPSSDSVITPSFESGKPDQSGFSQLNHRGGNRCAY